MTHQIILIKTKSMDSEQKVPTIDDNDQEVWDIDFIVESKLVLETPSLNPDETRQSLSGPGENRRSYWKSCKEAKRKSQNLQNIIKSLSNLIKSKVLSNLVKTNTKSKDEILTFTTTSDNFEPSACQSTIKY